MHSSSTWRALSLFCGLSLSASCSSPLQSGLSARPYRIEQAALSPDGSQILVDLYRTGPGPVENHLQRCSVASGDCTTLPSRSRSVLTSFWGWFADGKSFLQPQGAVNGQPATSLARVQIETDQVETVLALADPITIGRSPDWQYLRSGQQLQGPIYRIRLTTGQSETLPLPAAGADQIQVSAVGNRYVIYRTAPPTTEAGPGPSRFHIYDTETRQEIPLGISEPLQGSASGHLAHDESAWLIENEAMTRLLRIDPRTGKQLASYALQGQFMRPVGWNPDGSVWLLDRGTLYRSSADGLQKVFSSGLPSTMQFPLAINPSPANAAAQALLQTDDGIYTLDLSKPETGWKSLLKAPVHEVFSDSRRALILDQGSDPKVQAPPRFHLIDAQGARSLAIRLKGL